MYGTTYHMFGLTYSLEKLLAQVRTLHYCPQLPIAWSLIMRASPPNRVSSSAQLLEGLKLERAVLRGEIPEEDEALTTRRKFNYCRWNACVVDAQRLGEGAYVDVGDEYEAFAARCVELPQAFTQEQEPTEADIRRILQPEIVTCVRAAFVLVPALTRCVPPVAAWLAAFTSTPAWGTTFTPTATTCAPY